jgi:GTP-binding protein YchF
MECGLIGLPNVGKSTLFNALTSTASAQAANYPFCTIEPNRGTVCVPDSRLEDLAKHAGSASTVPCSLTFVDIAGLVKGASQGEGLGNKFLSHIRNVDSLIHVVRCFEGEVTHVEGRVHPLSDIQIIETELMLADLQSIENRLGRKKAQDDMRPLLEKAHKVLSEGKWASTAPWEESEKKMWSHLNLLTLKPLLYVCNVSEEDLVSGAENPWIKEVRDYADSMGQHIVTVCCQLESEIGLLPLDEQQDFLHSLGVQESGLSQVIRATYDLLGLMTFFTVGPKEARAWTIDQSSTAFDAAGAIHTDFQKGFICAEVVGFQDYLGCASPSRLKEEGKVRIEGRHYGVHDGDVILFRFNV